MVVILTYLACFILPLHANYTCNNVANLTYGQIWQLFPFSPFQVYFTFTIGILALIVLSISLITWIYYPHFSIPSNIIFVIIVGSLVDIIGHLIEVSNGLIILAYYYVLKNQPQPADFGQMCSGVGLVSLLGNLTALYYNALFCIALAYSINNTLHQPFFSNLSMNIICVICIVVAFIVICVTQNPSNPFQGICLYRQANQASLTLLFLHLTLLFSTLFSLKKFKQKIPKNTYFKTVSHFLYYYIYMIIFAVVETLNVLLFMIGYSQCQSKSYAIFSYLDTLSIIINVVYILQSFSIAFLRIGHPKLIMRIKQKIIKSNIAIDAQQKEWIASLVQSIKGSEILSFLQAILLNYIEHSSKYPRQLTPYHFQRQYNFLLNESTAQEYIRRRITNRESHFNRQSVAGLKTLDYNVTIYTPEYYAELYRTQNIHLFASFDIRKNISLVKDQSYSNSGKSGQFFFCTYDYKFIFKTIQSYELQLYHKHLQNFHKYYTQHKKTLIVKLLGTYKFSRDDIKQEAIFLILMKNLVQLKKDFIIRTYDIKGSEFNRSTLRKKRQEKGNDEQLRRVTLMDNDFQMMQQRLHVSQQDSQEIKYTLKRDIQFLASTGVMDYSVLIIKRSGPRTSQIGQYQSVKEPGVFYNIGIIDYLQEWTFRRKAQRLFKTLITNQQVTVNSPLNYSKRLIEFINTII